MPAAGKWNRFKLAFATSLANDTARDTWSAVATDTLAVLDRAAQALHGANLHDDEAQEMLDRVAQLRREVPAAVETYNAATNAAQRKLALAALERIDTEAQALVTQAHGWLRGSLDAIKGSEGGRAAIDDMMDQVDWGNPSDDDRDFGIAALKARFDIDTVDGKLGHKAMPRLYALMKGLPDGHVRDNPRFKKIERNVDGGVGGVYRGAEDAVVLTMKRSTGPLKSTFTPDADDVVDERYRPERTATPVFNHVTLHEIGHAYDAKVGFMNARMGQAEYGGWELVTEKEVGQAFAERDGLLAEPAIAALPAHFVEDMLEDLAREGSAGLKRAKNAWQRLLDRAAEAPTRAAVLAEENVARFLAEAAAWGAPDTPRPSDEAIEAKISALGPAMIGPARKRLNDTTKVDAFVTSCRETMRNVALQGMAPAAAADAGIQKVLSYAAMAAPPWDLLEGHKAVATLQRFSEYGHGHWQLGARAATPANFLVGASVYTRSSAGVPFKYLAAARALSVTKYQWHAPPEWFAELYALYFAGKMKEAHPAVALFLRDLGEPFEV